MASDQDIRYKSWKLLNPPVFEVKCSEFPDNEKVLFLFWNKWTVWFLCLHPYPTKIDTLPLAVGAEQELRPLML